MAIELPDARMLSDEVLEALRLRALRGRELGFTEADIAALLGVARETVSRWWSAFRTDGLDGLPHDRTGRPPGSGRTLTDAQAAHLQAIIDRHHPEDVGIAQALWTRRAIRDLIRQEFGIDMPVRTIGEYLRRWGYTPKRPGRKARDQDPEEVRRWLQETYPQVAARAAREGAEVHWVDEMGVGANEHGGRGYARVGAKAEVLVSGKRFRVNLISAITNQGKVRFMTYTGTLTALVFLAFLQRLLRGARKKIFLVIDPHPAHEAQVVADWVAERADRIELVPLPKRTPELNPTEYLNNDVRGQVHAEPLPNNAKELESTFERVMTKLKHLAAHVKSFFQHPKVQYAAAAAST
jgi:transposase